MQTVEIKSFKEAILFTLQSRKVGLLNFNELWQLCAKAALNIPGAAPENGLRKKFVRDLLQACELLELDGHIVRHTKDGGSKLYRVTLTKRGQEYIGSVVFTHQERMGRSDD